jgi:hypothetical protein
VLAGKNNAAIAVLELPDFTDELLGHAAPVSYCVPRRRQPLFRLFIMAPAGTFYITTARK